MRAVVVVLAIFIAGCDFLSPKNDALTLLKASSKGDHRTVWELTSEKSIDKTLASQERDEESKKFSTNWPSDLEESLRDLARVSKDAVKYEEIGANTDEEKTVYAIQANYAPNKGFAVNEWQVARSIKVLVEKNNKTGLIRSVKFDKPLEIDNTASDKGKAEYARTLLAGYKTKNKDNQGNIKKIFELYAGSALPFPELAEARRVVEEAIKKGDYDSIIAIESVDGYAERGNLINMARGYGMTLKKFVTIRNKTIVPIKVSFKYDLEESYFREAGKRCGWFNCEPVYESGYSGYRSGIDGALKLYSDESDSSSMSFDDIDYYTGYYVSDQGSDGSWNYRHDKSRGFRATNLTVTSIAVWTDPS